MMQSLLIAIQFLTCLPTPKTLEMNDRAIGLSLNYYPVVGLLIGLILLAVYGFCNDLDPLLQASLVLVTWIILSGGLHLDGLADSVDALVGGFGDRERTLSIMKDPCCGPFGVIALLITLLLKFTALITLLADDNGYLVFLIPIVARMLPSLFFMSTPYCRAQGLGTVFTEHMQRKSLTISLFFTCAFVLIVGWSMGMLLLLTLLLTFYWVRTLSIKRIGGVTGDVIGAGIEVFEVAALVVLAFYLS